MQTSMEMYQELNLKIKKKDVGAYHTTIWICFPFYRRDMYILVNALKLLEYERYVRTCLGSRNGKLEYKKDFYSTLYHCFCFVITNVFLKFLKNSPVFCQ